MPKTVDIGALVDVTRQPKVSLNGEEHVVLPLTATAAHRIAIATEQGVASEIVAAMVAAARESAPSLGDAHAALSLEQVMAVVAIARDGADAVEALIAERAAGK